MPIYLYHATRQPSVEQGVTYGMSLLAFYATGKGKKTRKHEGGDWQHISPLRRTWPTFIMGCVMYGL